MKKCYDLLPISFYDPAGLETWLGDQSARGRHLLSMKAFVSFEKGEPKRLKYRVEPNAGKHTSAEERCALYEEFGWEHVCPAGKLFHVWRSDEENPPELHTDSVLEAELMEPLHQKWKTTRWLLPLTLAFIVLSSGFALFGNPHPLLFSVQGGSGLSMLFLIPVYCVLFGTAWRDANACHRLMEQMKNGLPRPHWRKLSWCDLYLQKAVLAVALCGVVLAWLSLFWTLGQRHINLLDYPGALPIATLAEIENHPNFAPDYSPFEWETDRHRNEISFTASALATRIMEIEEEGIVAGKTYPDSGKPYNPRLSATYYELRFSFLAKPLLEDLVADELEYRIYDSVTVEAIYETAFDEIFLIGYGEGDTPNLLLARLGSRVLKLQYIGESNLRPQLDLIAQRLADFTPVREG